MTKQDLVTTGTVTGTGVVLARHTMGDKIEEVRGGVVVCKYWCDFRWQWWWR